MQYCDYGCGVEAKFELKNGKKCCSKFFSQCAINREKNSKGCLNRKERGECYHFTDTDRRKSRDKICEEFVKNKLVEGVVSWAKTIKNVMIEYLKIPNECSKCGLKSWNDMPIVLELDHIDGDAYNNKPDNLRLLCPNCHSQTKNFRGRNKNNGKIKVSEEKLKDALIKNKNIRQALLSVGLAPKGGNYKTAKLILYKYGIEFGAVAQRQRQRA